MAIQSIEAGAAPVNPLDSAKVPSAMHVTTDYLVIGSGVAGLSFALEAAAHGDVLVVTKRSADESNTKYA